MKQKLLLTLLVASLFTWSAQGQNATNRWSWNNFVTFSTVHDGDSKEYLSLKKSSIGFETGASYYANPSFNVSGFIGLGSLDYENVEFNFTDLGVLGEYKFNNGYILQEDFWFKPYLSAGLGHTWQEDAKSLDIPMGAGAKFALTDNLDLNVKAEYNALAKDEAVTYWQTQLGLNWAIGKGKGGDRDGDGVANKMDACPNEKGLKEYNGCPPPPDTDGDGIADAADECPNVAGVASFNGCPDSDGDGIKDADDKCPKEAGLKKYDGCPAPDQDNDGIIDEMDKCPTEAGSAALNGCPDQDGDGIIDTEDKCPAEAGVSANNGCPALDKEEQKVMEEALQGVNFVSGKNILTAESKPKLDKVAELLKAHPKYKLKISGYTDSAGAEESNLTLSKLRASAVKEYLIGDGIDGSRIEADGFGEMNPIADNGTREGRAKNRRVEFEMVY